MKTVIQIQKEWKDTLTLADKIIEDEWICPSTVIVNCFPEYSSRLTQTLNHLLRKVNRNNLFEQVDMGIPFPSYTQVWNPINKAYEGFDTYLKNWINENVFSCNFLFVTNHIDSRYFNKIKLSMRNKLDNENFRFCSLYVDEQSTFFPDYYTEKTNQPIQFEWEK